MKNLADCFLYGILDLAYVDRAEALQVATAMMEGGIDVIQLRAKNLGEGDIEAVAKILVPLAREAAVPLILNDFPHLAAAVGADGTHVGQDDLPIAEARRLASVEDRATPRQLVIGKSTHSVAQAIAAGREGADYVGFGPLFATPTKPDYNPIGLDDIARVHELVRVPIFCIGGIKLENLAAVLAAGAQRVVIVSGILQAADVAGYTRAAKALLLHNLNRNTPV